MQIVDNCVSVSALPHEIFSMLPAQGSIELQRDAPGKEHAWHTHPTDETLLILAGSLRFYWEGGERICRPGDAIRLPAGTRHGSVALADGAVYAIALTATAFDALLTAGQTPHPVPRTGEDAGPASHPAQN
jgi:hypothetical protein